MKCNFVLGEILANGYLQKCKKEAVAFYIIVKYDYITNKKKEIIAKRCHEHIGYYTTDELWKNVRGISKEEAMAIEVLES
jgi:hypothetical protein